MTFTTDVQHEPTEPTNRRRRIAVRNVLLIVGLFLLVATRFWARQTKPNYLPGSNRRQIIVGAANFSQYCKRTYSNSSFYQLGTRADDLVCSDRSDIVWQTQVITPSQVCLFEFPDSEAVQTKQTEDAEKNWSCIKPA